MKTREQHLAWCKETALGILDNGDTKGAFDSIMMNLEKHPETSNNSSIELGAILFPLGYLNSITEVREFIEDCE